MDFYKVLPCYFLINPKRWALYIPPSKKSLCFRKTEKIEIDRKHKVVVKKVVVLQSLKFQSRATREADCFINNLCNS